MGKNCPAERNAARSREFLGMLTAIRSPKNPCEKMVARKLLVQHNHSHFHVDYETEDGLDVLKFQLFSLTSIPPDDQKIFGERNQFISTDSDLDLAAEKLRLVSINDHVKQEEEETAAAATSSSNDAAGPLKSDEELARMLQAEEEELFFQQFRANENQKAFEERIRPYVKQVLQYEDQVRQEAARMTVPFDNLEEKALVSLAKEGNFRPSKQEEDHAFLLQLLFWFKHSFRWVNSPPCDRCGDRTNFIRMGDPLASEVQFGGSQVELYRCNKCSTTTRFPRYNDPLKLVETRRGRCGEWANCFTLYCRAFGYESRLILDFTDHVWTECYSEYLGRWMHLDPCEGIYDNPLLYESGWGKKLNYVIGIAKDGVYDLTRRYTRKWHEVLSRRNITTEPIASAVLSCMRNECRKHLTSEDISKLEDRDRKEAEELERGIHSQDADLARLPGRQSGAKEWRLERGELGVDKTDSWSSSCPLRICVDDHVTEIYNALSHLVSQLISNDFSKAKSLELLETIKNILINIQKISFKVRRTSISADSGSLLFSMHKVMPSIDGLLASLSLKRESLTDGEVYVRLSDDPVKTSLALPVAVDAIDDGIVNVRNAKNFGTESLSLPLLTFNRICSGSVIASGEELPFGIATSAFDGTHFSKWEEPNGAKGCWIIYLVKDGQMHNLQAYELVSANDAPERDPMDWMLEGSSDGGSSWIVLDKQTSQLFERRFQRKTFLIESNECMSNAFRFSFLAVRDGNATSRLQIGSIDLYAKAS